MMLEQKPSSASSLRFWIETGATSNPRLPFGDDKAIERQAVEDFAQRADADAIVLLETFKLELLTGAETPKICRCGFGR